jgi:predicted nucleic acid-binding protein
VRDLVVDASVALKWFIPELDSPDANRLISRDVRLVAPRVLHVEIANGLWKAGLRQQISHAEAKNFCANIERLISTWHSDQALMDDALDFALRLRHPIYDCLYLALAERCGTCCVTVDKRLLSVAPNGLALPLSAWIG